MSHLFNYSYVIIVVNKIDCINKNGWDSNLCTEYYGTKCKWNTSVFAPIFMTWTLKMQDFFSCKLYWGVGTLRGVNKIKFYDVQPLTQL